MGDNATLVKNAYAAFGRGDVPAVIDLVDEKVDWSSPATLPQGGHFEGKGQVGQFFQGIGDAWESLSIEVESLSEAGSDLVIGVVHGDGRLKDGTASGYGATHVFTVRDGKIARFREYTDLDEPLG